MSKGLRLSLGGSLPSVGRGWRWRTNAQQMGTFCHHLFSGICCMCSCTGDWQSDCPFIPLVN